MKTLVRRSAAQKGFVEEQGLYTDDLESMNEREAEKYVKKDNIWKKPDYQAMIDEGIPLGVVYYIKKVRDCLPASPRYPYGDNTTEKGLPDRKNILKLSDSWRL